jgi:hypothetical protein
MPEAYQRHDPRRCAYCQQRTVEAGQEGLAALLRGERECIAPEGFDAAHQRITRVRVDVMQDALSDGEVA